MKRVVIDFHPAWPKHFDSTRWGLGSRVCTCSTHGWTAGGVPICPMHGPDAYAERAARHRSDRP